VVIAVMAQFTSAQVSRSKADEFVFSLLGIFKRARRTTPKKPKFCQCTSFGEATSAITIDGSTTDFFKLFYRNSPKAAL